MPENRFDDEINLIEYINVIKKHWQLIVKIIIGTVLVAFVFSLLQKPVYEATATIYVRGGGGASFSQYSSLAGMMGINLPGGERGGGIKDVNQLIQSRVVAKEVLTKLNLRKKIKNWDNSDISDDKLALSVKGLLQKPEIKGNILSLSIEYTDPEIATDIANYYAEAFGKYWNRLNYSEAQSKKDYIESQFPRVEKDLVVIEERIKSYTLLGASNRSIEMKRLAREFEIQNSIFILLRKELETVKLEQSKEIPSFTILDEALVPKTPIKPKTKLNVMIAFVLGTFIGMFIAFFKEYLNNLSKND